MLHGTVVNSTRGHWFESHWKSDHINRMITLSVIILRSVYSIFSNSLQILRDDKTKIVFFYGAVKNAQSGVIFSKTLLHNLVFVLRSSHNENAANILEQKISEMDPSSK